MDNSQTKAKGNLAQRALKPIVKDRTLKRREYHRHYRLKNREHLIKYNRKYNETHQDKIRQKVHKNYHRRRDEPDFKVKHREQAQKYYQRHAHCPNFVFQQSQRRRESKYQERADRCYVCGITEKELRSKGYKRGLQFHHLNYRYPKSDVITVCSKCHAKFHNFGRKKIFGSIVRALKPFTAEIPKERVLNFGADAAFGRYKQFFPEAAIAHPAKACLSMIEWIIKRYMKEGDMVLDVMAGTCSTGIVAALNNRNAICVELEEKFYKWGLEAKRRVEQTQTFMQKGQMIVLNGDARELSKILAENVDAIVFSPPFASEQSDPKGASGGGTTTYQKKYGYSTHYEVNGNIADLPYVGGIDVVLFSPPFTNVMFADRKFVIVGGRGKTPRERPRYTSRYDEFGPDDIGGLPYGRIETDGGGLELDAVIFSPPYAEAQTGGGIAKHGYDGSKHSKTDLVGRRTYMPENVGQAPGNISNFDYGLFDAIVTSPLYEGSLSPDSEGPGATTIKKGATKSSQSGYTETKDIHNIGNLKADTYLGAMFQVYRECFKVLKPGGVMVLITKNFVRNKKVVRLDLDTIKLCEAAGFTYVERWYRKLEQPSFWRIIYAKKFHYCPRCSQVYRVRNSTSDRPSLSRCVKCEVPLLPALLPYEDIMVFRRNER